MGGGSIIGWLNTAKPPKYVLLPVNREPFSLLTATASFLQYDRYSFQDSYFMQMKQESL